jgi:secondary thiamine-phosphate synthase enzyme
METGEIEVETGRSLVTDVTAALRRFCHGHGDGLVNVFVPHATAGLALMETGSGSEADLERAVGRLVPRDGGYTHSHGSAGHGADHVLPAFVSPSVTIPVVAGTPMLGIWQSLVLVDSNVDNRRRRVRFSLLEEQ